MNENASGEPARRCQSPPAREGNPLGAADADLFQILAEQSPNMIFVNKGGRVVFANRQCEVVLGYTRADMCAEDFDFMVLICPEHRDLVVKNFRAHQRGEEVPPYEYALLAKDGRRIDTVISSRLILHGGERAILGIVTDITELKQNAEAARNSAKLLSTTLESLDGFLAVMDRDLRVVLSNWKYHAFVTEEERRGRPHCYRVFKHRDERCDYCPPLETFADGKPRVYEDRNPVDGTFMEIRVAPIFDDSGAVALVMEYLQDITKRKQAEELLKTSGEMLRGSFHYSNDAIILCDLAGAILDANQTAVNQLAFSREEILARTMDELLPAGRLERSRAALREAAERGFVKFLVDYRRKNGSVFPAEVSASLFEVGGRKVVQHTIRDITERVIAEAALKESEERFRTLFEAAPDAIFLTDVADGMIIDANFAAERLLEKTKREIIGSHQSQLHPPEMADEARRLFSDCSAGDNVRGVETLVCRKDGSAVPVHIVARVINLVERRVLLGVFRDMTEEKRAEEDRLQLARQLCNAEKLESLGVVAGGIAHDFNNLLQGVFGYISLARMNLDQKEKAQDLLRQAEKALDISVNLTNQLLTFARGGQPLKKTLQPRQVIEDGVKFALSGSSSDFLLDLAPDLWLLEADGGQLSQVVQNIVLNASQAMPEGGTVRVFARNVEISPGKARTAPAAGRFVRIDVGDSGAGIPRELLPRIFDPFFTTKPKGTGLGLATAHSIVQNHGGWIGVDSEAGRGTTVSIFMPAATDPAEECAAPAEPTLARRGRILFMDDDPLVRSIARETVPLLGHEVECAATGKEAVEKFTQARDAGRPFDVVVLDLTVRGGMGGEATILKLLKIDPQIKAVVSSGYADNPVMANYRAHGFAACLAKPVKIEALQDCLNRLL